MINKKKTNILLIGILFLFLFNTVNSADYKFQNSTGENLTIIHGDTGNLTVKGDISGKTGYFNLAWNYLTNIPNLVFGLWNGNNINNLLVYNGTAIGYNQTIFNQTALDFTNKTMYSGYGKFWYNQTGDLWYNQTLHGDNRFVNVDGDVMTGKLNISAGGLEVIGDTNFNGGWQAGGATVYGGDLYAQSIYVYNITSLSVDTLNVNGSLIPQSGFSNTFDIGNETLQWKNGYFGTDVFISGIGIKQWQYNQTMNWTTNGTAIISKPGISQIQIGNTLINTSSGLFWYNQTPQEIWVDDSTNIFLKNETRIVNISNTLFVTYWGQVSIGTTDVASQASLNTLGPISISNNSAQFFGGYVNETVNGGFRVNTYQNSSATNFYNNNGSAGLFSFFNDTWLLRVVPKGIQGEILPNWTIPFAVSSDGNVSIGDSLTTYPFKVSVNTSIHNFFYVFPDKVGIGTSTPTHTLTVNGSASITGNLTVSDTTLINTSSGLFWYNQTSAAGNISGGGTFGNLTKWIGSKTVGDSVIYESGGNVGIGSSDVPQKLVVKGDVNVTNKIYIGSALTYTDEGGNMIFRI